LESGLVRQFFPTLDSKKTRIHSFSRFYHSARARSLARAKRAPESTIPVLNAEWCFYLLNTDETMPIFHLFAGGKEVQAALPCALEDFFVSQGLLLRSVVVERNDEALVP